MRPPESDTRRPAVTVAVLNYNGRHLLEIVLPSLAAQEHSDFETVVVDDCSTDDSIEYLRERWPQVRVALTGTPPTWAWRVPSTLPSGRPARIWWRC